MNGILFVGGVYPKDKTDEILKKSKSGIQLAANSLQWKLIEGIESVIGKPITILNQMFVGSYPKKHEDWYIPSFEFSHTQGAVDYNIGYLNITGLKQYITYPLLKQGFKKLIKQRNDIGTVIFYSVQGSHLRLSRYIKKKYGIKTHMIVPDLPQYMAMQHTDFIRTYMKKKNCKLLENCLDYIDSFTFLTKYMAEKLKIDRSRYTVVEGIADFKNTVSSADDDGIKRVVYTGTLTAKYGIMDLVEAFMDIKKENYRLIICGSGETAEKIKAAAKLDERIIFKGNVSPDEAVKIQQAATVLVNPRKNDEEYTKYSFPSKLMEYLLSGMPTVCYKLDGIPDEYDRYFQYVSDNTKKELSDKIVEVCELSNEERAVLGKTATRFVSEQKNKEVQCSKIMQLIYNEGFGK